MSTSGLDSGIGTTCDQQHWFPGVSDGTLCLCGRRMISNGIAIALESPAAKTLAEDARWLDKLVYVAYATDNQLIAELQRRHPNHAAMLDVLTDVEVVEETKRRGLWPGGAKEAETAWRLMCERSYLKDRLKQVMRDREWAEERLVKVIGEPGLKAMCDGKEQGPGIAQTAAPTEGHYVDPLDLLADDE